MRLLPNRHNPVVRHLAKEEAFRAGVERTIYDFWNPCACSAAACDGTYRFSKCISDYKTEEQQALLLVEYLQYVTKETMNITRYEEYIQRAQHMEGVHWEQRLESRCI